MNVRSAVFFCLLVFTGVPLMADSVRIAIGDGSSVGATALKAGSYKVSWNGEGDQVQVTFARSNETVAQAKGRFVSRSSKASHTGIVVRDNGGGSRTITELVIRGRSEVIVLDQ